MTLSDDSASIKSAKAQWGSLCTEAAEPVRGGRCWFDAWVGDLRASFLQLAR